MWQNEDWSRLVSTFKGLDLLDRPWQQRTVQLCHSQPDAFLCCGLGLNWNSGQTPRLANQMAWGHRLSVNLSDKNWAAVPELMSSFKVLIYLWFFRIISEGSERGWVALPPHLYCSLAFTCRPAFRCLLLEFHIKINLEKILYCRNC